MPLIRRLTLLDEQVTFQLSTRLHGILWLVLVKLQSSQASCDSCSTLSSTTPYHHHNHPLQHTLYLQWEMLISKSNNSHNDSLSRFSILSKLLCVSADFQHPVRVASSLKYCGSRLFHLYPIYLTINFPHFILICVIKSTNFTECLKQIERLCLHFKQHYHFQFEGEGSVVVELIAH